VLLEAIIAEFYDGKILVGRGVPSEWLQPEKTVEVTNFPISHNGRMNIRIKALSDKQVQLDVEGDKPSNVILFNLPIFDSNIEKASVGIIDEAQGWVILDPSVRSATITLKNRTK
jgi:hypothetical protein